MKISVSLSLLALVSATGSTSAFVAVPLQASKVSRTAPLEAAKNGRWGPVVSGAVVGWALATQLATASVNPQALDSFQPGIFGAQSDCPTTLLSLGAYQPETGYASLDMAMPSYKVEDISAPKDELSDPVKEEARAAKLQSKAQAAEEREQAAAKKYFEKQQAKAKDVAEQGAIKARVEAGRQATREAKMAAKQ